MTSAGETSLIGLANVGFLLVDDNRNMLTIVDSIIRAFGARKITHAVSENEAVSILKSAPCDIMVCDYILGRYTICDISREIRKSRDDRIKFMPIILLTAHTSLSRIQAARDAGINNVCAKPVSTTDLFRRLATVVDHPVPFIACNAYTGPDRRRKNRPPYTQTERRTHVPLAPAAQ